ncbi:hypothetical protein ABZP36_011743 [Zizania latifolia]
MASSFAMAVGEDDDTEVLELLPRVVPDDNEDSSVVGLQLDDDPAASGSMKTVEAPADGSDCPICLNGGSGEALASSSAAAAATAATDVWKETACGHRFHAGCVEWWARVKRSCPICRRAIDVTAAAADLLERDTRALHDDEEELLDVHLQGVLAAGLRQGGRRRPTPATRGRRRRAGTGSERGASGGWRGWRG